MLNLPNSQGVDLHSKFLFCYHKLKSEQTYNLHKPCVQLHVKVLQFPGQLIQRIACKVYTFRKRINNSVRQTPRFIL